jgi:O-antigen/teichoic acid export membrane protein
MRARPEQRRRDAFSEGSPVAHRLQSLTRVTSLLLFGRVVGVAFGLINSVVLARVLGTDGLGQYAYAMGLAAMFGLLPNLGLSTVITRAVAQDPRGGGGIIRIATRAQALLGLAVLGLILLVAAVLPSQPVSLWLIGLAAAQLVLGSFTWPYLAVLGGHSRYDRVAVVELIAGATGTIGVLLAARLGGRIDSFLWAHVVSAGVSIAIARIVVDPYLPQVQEGGRTVLSVVRQALPFGATAAVQSLYTRVDMMLLGQLSSSAMLGLYSAAYKPINMVLNFGASAAGTLFPYLVQESGGDPSGSFERVMRVFLVVAPALALVMGGISETLLRVLFGTQFAAGATMLTVLAWSSAANWLYAPCGIALQARGKEQMWMRALAYAFLLNVLLNLWAIPRWGGVGAAVSTLICEIGLLTAGSFMMVRYLGPVLSRATVMASGSATTLGLAVWLGLKPWGNVRATIAAGLVYLAVLWLLRVATTADITKLVGRFRESVQGHARA